MSQVFHFSPGRFGVLKFFMRYPGRTYTCTMIIRAIWGKMTAPISNIIESYLRGIRRKLRAAGVYGLLRTVHGLGYGLHP
ncbi:helix-turn-helix domain-containing protein [Deinococcus radiomollis]|uniref:helix-turn-helix domain-containing protein n=1 Tax=Deinococcus radiomollis TaxID=468916 RepID=UPI003892190F